MRLGIMQPYFFPYLGHFSLIAKTDRWVAFDITQYTPKTWLNRNRILHPTEGWVYINAPLVCSSISLKIQDARVADVKAVHRTLLGKISHYRRRAPFYEQVQQVINQAFASMNDDSLVELNLKGIKAVCQYLDIPFRYQRCSQLNLDLAGVSSPGGWAPAICSQLNASSYLNPIGGRSLFDCDDFRKIGVSLEFLEFTPAVYETSPFSFVPNLSVLDVLMWNPPSSVKDFCYAYGNVLSAA